MALSPEVLARLARYSTPTIANGLEQLDVRPWNQGYMGPEIRCIYPDLAPMVGYAVTATIMADRPDIHHRGPSRADYWDYILSMPAPRVIVMQDLDPHPTGSYWGEVNAHVHRALGCIGVVTNGGVRDLEEVAAQRFHFFAREILVSHAYVHLVDFGTPVTVGGMEIRPGDLIHGDRHGVMTIPESAAEDVERGIAIVAERERRIIAACEATPFDLSTLKEIFG